MILIDLNMLLDVVQTREPHYRASAAVLEAVVNRHTVGALPAHEVTMVHYVVKRHRDRETADRAVDWLLRYFAIIPVRHSDLLRARGLQWADLEDAVVAAAAESGGCRAIVTRNVKHFENAPVPAWTPDEYLLNEHDRHRAGRARHANTADPG